MTILWYHLEVWSSSHKSQEQPAGQIGLVTEPISYAHKLMKCECQQSLIRFAVILVVPVECWGPCPWVKQCFSDCSSSGLLSGDACDGNLSISNHVFFQCRKCHWIAIVIVSISSCGGSLFRAHSRHMFLVARFRIHTSLNSQRYKTQHDATRDVRIPDPCSSPSLVNTVCWPKAGHVSLCNAMDESVMSRSKWRDASKAPFRFALFLQMSFHCVIAVMWVTLQSGLVASSCSISIWKFACQEGQANVLDLCLKSRLRNSDGWRDVFFWRVFRTRSVMGQLWDDHFGDLGNPPKFYRGHDAGFDSGSSS